ncbi:MAG: aspartate--tRNA ligase [Eubacteriales bacterium]|nr:aspartate--tRNA ligase [Eubacteriales bacterium]MDD3073597.1 aspartate--tRNA ligase [Eubacteriales bacterium]MDD4769540.1 aspartate--tRNA ligase [Eubacteriales bacterium]
MKRTHKCGELRLEHAGHQVSLCGWVAKRRDLGGMIFLDLRDRWGLAQVVYYPDSPGYKLADQVRSEYVVRVQGSVKPRENNVNPDLPTGEIEVVGGEMEILNTASLPPFYITDDVKVDENLRLRYRYLDLRRPLMQANLVLRSKAASIFRNFLASHDFIEVETPILTKSTPEGARDFLVPSRVSPGKFYALPQSPQLLKQLLMVAGLERYYQLARCFRDEDLRADRQLEFTQVDIEVSFMEQDEFFALIEELVGRIFTQLKGVELPRSFPRIPWHTAMEKYGSDKPDLRFAMEIVDISGIAAASEFKVFTGAIAAGGSVRGIKVPATFSRKELDQLTEQVKAFGAQGLAWMAVENEGVRSPIAKFFGPGQIEQLTGEFAAKPGDMLLFVADRDTFGVVLPALGALRVELGRQLKLYGAEVFKPCWVVDFPLFEYDTEEERFVAAHHPFTAPVPEDVPKLASDPGSARAQAYDLVLNGWEIAGGSVRIHTAEVQQAMFKAIGIDLEQARGQFGFLLEALAAGAPPHRGIAFGFDRLVAILAGESSIRNVIAFPKTNSASDPMTDAPSVVDEAQLAELKIKIRE